MPQRRQQSGGIDAGNGPRFELGLAAVGNDVDRLAALQRADLKRGVGRFEDMLEWAGGEVFSFGASAGQNIGDGMDCVQSRVRTRGMAGLAPDRQPGGGLALVGADCPHAARLADDRAKRGCAELRQAGDHVRHAAAAGLLVIGKGKVDGLAKWHGSKRWDGGENGGEEALHVGGAATVEAVRFGPQAERIAGPAALGGGDHVHMA